MRYGSLCACLAVLLMSAAGAEDGTLTIVGVGNGPVTVVEKDGTVHEVAVRPLTVPVEKSALRAPRPKEPRLKLEPKTAKAAQPAKQEPAAEKKDAAEEAKKAEELARKTREAEARRYYDKDYSYGPGSSADEDHTGKAVRQNTTRSSRFSRQEQAAASDSPEPAPTSDDAGGRFDRKRR